MDLPAANSRCPHVVVFCLGLAAASLCPLLPGPDLDSGFLCQWSQHLTSEGQTETIAASLWSLVNPQFLLLIKFSDVGGWVGQPESGGGGGGGNLTPTPSASLSNGLERFTV